MPRTDRVTANGLAWWVEYESATREPNGSWKSTAAGRVRFQHDDGTTFVAELETKTAYGRSAEHAEAGARTRALRVLERVVEFMRETRDPGSAAIPKG